MGERCEITREKGFMANFKAARFRFIDAVADLSIREMDEPIVGGFSAKDLAAHILEWDWSAIDNSRRYLAGKEPDYTPDWDNDAFNEIAVSLWRNSHPMAVFYQFSRSTAAVLDFVNGLTEEELFRDRGLRFWDQEESAEKVVTVSWFLGEFEHDEGHAKQIRDWMRNRTEHGHQES